jgi:hypothetical protein
MTRIEEITRGSSVRGILPEGLVTILDVKWIGTVAVEVTYKDSRGWLGIELIYRDRLRFIEVKGRAEGAKTVTITKNEILTALNKPDEFILAIGVIDGDRVELRGIRRPFHREPDFLATRVNFAVDELLVRGTAPV